jgi:hypothetical protein
MLQPSYAHTTPSISGYSFLVVTVCLLVHIWLENTSASVHNRINPLRIGPSLKGHFERLAVGKRRLFPTAWRWDISACCTGKRRRRDASDPALDLPELVAVRRAGGFVGSYRALKARRFTLAGFSCEAAPACLRLTGAVNSQLGLGGWNS